MADDIASALCSAFLQACREGDAGRAAEHLLGIEDAEVGDLVRRMGGRGALVRFLVQRRHLLHAAPEGAPLASWLVEHLREAEPMHLLNVQRLLPLAEEAGYEWGVYRLRAHLKFVQPPDPTRWSRKMCSPKEVAFLDSCARADLDAMRDALEDDPELVHARNKWGEGAATLLGAHPSERGPEAVSILCDAGLRRSADAVVTAASRGAVATVEALLAHGFPVRRGIDHDALWSAAEATGRDEAARQTFESIAKMLAEGGASPDVVDRWGSSAWGVASPSARPVLEELGATPRERGDARYDPETGCSPALATGERAGEDLDLNEAAAVGDVERVRHLLDDLYQHRPVLCANGPPERPLHLAAYHGRVPVVWLLIRYYGYSPGDVNEAGRGGLHVGPTDTWGKTALEVAVRRRHDKVVDMLLNSVDWFQGRRARRK